MFIYHYLLILTPPVGVCAITETENSWQEMLQEFARSRPVYHCHGYLVRKTDGGIMDAMIE